MINLKALQDRIVAFKKKNHFDEKTIHWECCKLLVEVGEMAESILSEDDQLGNELADVINCVLYIAAVKQIDIEAELLKKIDIVEKRQYTMIDGIIHRTRNGEN